MYNLLKPLLYTLPPEQAHYFAMYWLGVAHRFGLTNLLAATNAPKDAVSLFGLSFPNKIGLAAGFDKDARWMAMLEALGFGFIEVGTLTPKPQPGNEKPRLFRLEKDEALINRMGFNNQGVEAALERIKSTKLNIPLGGNIGKNKLTTNDCAAEDYLTCFKALYDHVDYFTVNVSSPNTPGLRELQGKDELLRIFDALISYRVNQHIKRPVLLKIAPDLTNDQLSEIVSLVAEMDIDGIVATNTTLSREGLNSSKALIDQAGGLSGKPLAKRSTEVIKTISDMSGGRIPIIGAGGIHTAEDALEKLAAGASLIQLYTGFIYEGPGLIHKIKQATRIK